MSTPRGLSEEEAAVWAKVAATVTPMEGKRIPLVKPPAEAVVSPPKRSPIPTQKAGFAASSSPRPGSGADKKSGLDSHWDRRVKAGRIEPDYTLDLHGHTLDTAYHRLMDGMVQARAMDARVVLLIAGKSRPVDPADRGTKRGAIRAKILDWLAASPHGDAIAAVRKAHIRHGGEGALYLVLKRGR